MKHHVDGHTVARTAVVCYAVYILSMLDHQSEFFEDLDGLEKFLQISRLAQLLRKVK